MVKQFLKLTVEPTFSMSPDVKQTYEMIEYNNGDSYIKLSGINDQGPKVFYKKIISKTIVEEIGELLSKTTITVQPEEYCICDGDLITLEKASFNMNQYIFCYVA